jgi:hypothetical protein
MKKEVVCLRCGNEWLPYVRKPKRCPKCKSPYWNTPYTKGPYTTLKETNDGANKQ